MDFLRVDILRLTVFQVILTVTGNKQFLITLLLSVLCVHLYYQQKPNYYLLYRYLICCLAYTQSIMFDYTPRRMTKNYWKRQGGVSKNGARMRKIT